MARGGVAAALGEATVKIGVLSLQGAFREHLDTLHVGEVQVRTESAREIDAVDIQTDRWIGGQQEVELTHAADEGAHL